MLSVVCCLAVGTEVSAQGNPCNSSKYKGRRGHFCYAKAYGETKKGQTKWVRITAIRGKGNIPSGANIDFGGTPSGNFSIKIVNVDFLLQKKSGKFKIDTGTPNLVFTTASFQYPSDKITLMSNQTNPQDAIFQFSASDNWSGTLRLPFRIEQDGKNVSSGYSLVLEVPIAITGIEKTALPPAPKSLDCQSHCLSAGVDGCLRCLNNPSGLTMACNKKVVNFLTTQEENLHRQALSKKGKSDDRLGKMEGYLTYVERVQSSGSAGRDLAKSWQSRIDEVEGAKSLLDKIIIDRANRQVTAQTEREAWDKLKKQEAAYRQTGHPLSELEALYRTFLEQEAVIGSDLEQEAQRLIELGCFRAPSLRGPRPAPDGWQAYTVLHACALTVHRDPLNDYGWEVDPSGLTADPPILRVKKIGPSQRFRLIFKNTLFWDEGYPHDFTVPFTADVEQGDEYFWFSFQGGDLPYRLHWKSPEYGSTVLWSTEVADTIYRLHKDSLLGHLNSVENLPTAHDTLHLMAYAATNGSKFIPVPGSEWILPLPRNTNWQATASMALAGLALLGGAIFLWRRYGRSSRGPSGLNLGKR